MDTIVRHEELGSQTSSLSTVPIMAIPAITSVFTTTIPPPPPFFNPLLQQATPTPKPTTSEATTSFLSLPDFSYVFKFNDRVSNLEKDLSEIKQVGQYAQALFFIPTIKEAQAEKRDYIELVDTSMRAILKEEFAGLPSQPKTSRDDKDKDQHPSAGSVQGRKRKKSSKEAESSRDSSLPLPEEPSIQFVTRGATDSRVPTHGIMNEINPVDNMLTSRPPQTWISQVSRTKEPRTSFDELMDISFDFTAFVMNRLNIKDLTQEILAITKRLDWHNPEGKLYLFDLNKPLLLIQDHRGRQVILQDFFINNDLEYLKGRDLSRRPVTVKYDKHAYWGTSHWGPKRQHFYGFAANMSSSKDVYSRKRIIAVTRLTIMKKYDYGHLEEIEVRREDQKLYKFREGDFPRLRLQDIEDMLLLLVQQKLTNLTIDERYDLNVALRMFTRRIVIQRRVEDLQLGVESYQKKLNLTKPDTFRSNLRNMTTYTAYSDPKGVIYKDQNNKNRLMRADELHKFSDGTLNDVRTALHDIAKGIRMEYLPKRKWSGLDKRRARVMVQDIDKQLYERRLMRNLEKFVGGREYGNDLRLLERTI
ncbi:hypothetical protein Tco_0865891 [Tanacetum coccineum]